MIKKARFIALLIFSLWMTGHAQMMHVKEKSGTKTIFAFNDISKLTFSGGNMTVSGHDGNPETYALTTIRYVNFTDLSTGVYPLENKKTESLVLFPNPVQDMLTLNYKSLGEVIQFEIMTLDGKTVYRNIIIIQSGTNRTDINVTSLPKGMYLCRLIDGKVVLMQKILKY
jgi:hypothetical protein